MRKRATLLPLGVSQHDGREALDLVLLGELLVLLLGLVGDLLLAREQSQRAVNQHSTALAAGDRTCIDCHQGIAHSLPEGYLEEYQRVVESLGEKPSPELQQGALIDIDAIQKQRGALGSRAAPATS